MNGRTAMNIPAKYNTLVNRYLKRNPTEAHSLGIHQFDGKLPKYDPMSIQTMLEEIQEDITYLIQFEKRGFENKAEELEHSVLMMRLTSEQYQLKELESFKEEPLSYLFPLTLIETSYVPRNFASRDIRIQSIIQIENEIPNYLQTAVSNLNDILAKPKILMAINFLGGIISFLEDKLIGFMVQSENETLIQEWSTANVKAVNALKTFEETLRSEFLPHSKEDFALGVDKFLSLLKYTEFIDLDFDTLLKVGQQDLQTNFSELQEILDSNGGTEFLRQVLSETPNSQELIEWARDALSRTREFLLDEKIVSLPTKKQCEIIETPNFARKFAFAAMSVPGPFEPKEASQSYYWITPADLNLPEEKQREFLSIFAKSSLEVITIHEVWPGHYLQLLKSNNTDSDIIKIFSRSITMIEGYAHYCEEMILEEGYEPFDRIKLKVGQLLAALLRNCRYIAALKMHSGQMSVSEAKTLFTTKAFLNEQSAEIEANRGTVNPMYLNYTLGKLLIKRLRSDYKTEQGENFNLKSFHDTLLSYGSPPIVALRKLMLKNPGERII